jgi:hypothetical protein
LEVRVSFGPETRRKASLSGEKEERERKKVDFREECVGKNAKARKEGKIAHYRVKWFVQSVRNHDAALFSFSLYIYV